MGKKLTSSIKRLLTKTMSSATKKKLLKIAKEHDKKSAKKDKKKKKQTFYKSHKRKRKSTKGREGIDYKTFHIDLTKPSSCTPKRKCKSHRMKTPKKKCNESLVHFLNL
jgi:hypothetical protein